MNEVIRRYFHYAKDRNSKFKKRKTHESDLEEEN